VTAKNELKVFPNPIAANTNFSIAFNLKELGEYVIQFTDATGKLVSERRININFKNQVENFDGNFFRSAGIYFVRVNGKQNKIYSSKLVVR
jgi:hypothetical protein